MSTAEIDAEALKDYCPNCEAEHIHTSHGRCLGCFHRNTAEAAERLADETGEPVERFTNDEELPELDDLESVE